ncbi:unnamed protein product [marine sediment metagenome]|uniref:Oligopeptide transport permease C-like N-terminal domain-containing protein n=1 Tax=marine sediment metagenome TaxID=412755 RepID=X1FBX8_9ZZZZ
MSKKSIYFNILMKRKLETLKKYLYLLAQNKLTFAALIIILFLIIIAIIAPIIVPFPSHIYGSVNPQDKLLSPSWTYLFGTDEMGRDLFSRVLYGTRISLLGSLIAVAMGCSYKFPFFNRNYLCLYIIKFNSGYNYFFRSSGKTLKEVQDVEEIYLF